MVFTALLVSPVQHEPPALFSIYSPVVPQTGCWKRRKADRCCFSGFRVLGATGSTRFKYHRCFSTYAKMVKLQQETNTHFGQRCEIRDGVVWASWSCYLGLSKSTDSSRPLHRKLSFFPIFFIRELIKWHFHPSNDVFKRMPLIARSTPQGALVKGKTKRTVGGFPTVTSCLLLPWVG